MSLVKKLGSFLLLVLLVCCGIPIAIVFAGSRRTSNVDSIRMIDSQTVTSLPSWFDVPSATSDIDSTELSCDGMKNQCFLDNVTFTITEEARVLYEDSVHDRAQSDLSDLPDDVDASAGDTDVDAAGGDVDYDVGVVEASYQVGSPASVKEDRYGSDMGEPQIVDSTIGAEIEERIVEARRYMQDVVNVDPQYSKVRELCKNTNSQCAFWAVSGECDANPGYMHIQCGPVCYTCEKLHVETRCPLDPNAQDALAGPGELNKMFETIITDPSYQQFQPVVLSRPTYGEGDGPTSNVTYKVNSIWMVMFDNAVSFDEADRLIELGGLLGYERSADVGEVKVDGTYTAKVNSGRTSTNAWCVDNCYTDPVARTVMDRIANITGIPEVNSENLQLLRYEQDQFYQTHNDYIEYQVDRLCGVRLLTFYIYLNDVEEGGGTNFPKLGLTVTPKKGRAVLWPSVYDYAPNAKDPRSDHQAMPVIKGTKYGANAWIHQRDFKTANKVGCS